MVSNSHNAAEFQPPKAIGSVVITPPQRNAGLASATLRHEVATLGKGRPERQIKCTFWCVLLAMFSTICSSCLFFFFFAHQKGKTLLRSPVLEQARRIVVIAAHVCKYLLEAVTLDWRLTPEKIGNRD